MSKIELADERLHELAGWRLRRRIPIRVASGSEERLLVEVFLEHVESFAHEVDRAIAIGAFRERAEHERRVPERDGRESEVNRRSRRIRRWQADVEQRVERLFVPGDGNGTQACRGTAQQLLKADVLVGELERFDQIVFVRSTVDAEETNRGRNRR